MGDHVIVDIFTSTGVSLWTKPPGCVLTKAMLLGGGRKGSSGSVGATVSGSSGGAGSGASLLAFSPPPGDSESIYIQPGATSSVNNLIGRPTSFGPFSASVVHSDETNVTNKMFAGATGGAGGATSSSAAQNGTAGSASGNGVRATLTAGGSGGIVGGASPTSGTSAVAGEFQGGGGGGGGAAANGSGTGQNGADGGLYGGGGGGGGASVSGTAGTGGNGAQGLAIIQSFIGVSGRSVNPGMSGNVNG
jgi:hypothetical protein